MIKQKTKQNIKNLILKQTNTKRPKILLALSGGPDSVFLFHVLKRMYEENSLELICAHLDHEWRSESKYDLDFCINLCKKHSIEIFTTSARQLNLEIKYNGSKEEIGRKLRLNFLEKIRRDQNCDFITTAHHQQDQIETFFIRLIRGCHLTGLTGIKEVNGKYLRPILDINKKDILNYLDKNKIKYITDKTNNSDDFLRNRIRKYILPALTKSDTRANKKFITSMQNLKETDIFLQKIVTQTFNEVFKLDKQKKYYIGNLELFLKQDPFLKKQLILHWLVQEKILFNPSKAFIEEILRFLNSKQGGLHKTGRDWQIFKKKNWFLVSKCEYFSP